MNIQWYLALKKLFMYSVRRDGIVDDADDDGIHDWGDDSNENVEGLSVAFA